MYSLRTLAIAATLSVAAATHAAAADVYVVHGINGADLGAASSLPVDVCLDNGTPVLTGVTFGAIAGPLQLPAGRYGIEIRLAGQGAACGGTLAIPATVNLTLAENVTLVAHVTEQGTPALTKFVNDVRKLDASSARVVVRHGAAVPPVDVVLRKGGRFGVVRNLENSDQSSALDVLPGGWRATILAEGVKHPVGPVDLPLAAGKLTIAYAVGSLASGTFAIVPHVIAVP